MKIEIFLNTIETYMTWEVAESYCNSLGDGWRLPTKDELIHLYNTIPNEFGNYGCWGDRFNLEYSWSVGFKTGNVYLNLKNNQNYLRPVRNGK
jgi:hypothetical protein